MLYFVALTSHSLIRFSIQSLFSEEDDDPCRIQFADPLADSAFAKSESSSRRRERGGGGGGGEYDG